MCAQYKRSKLATPSELRLLGLSERKLVALYQLVGCHHCNCRGYQGRTGIYELVAVTYKMRDEIYWNASKILIEINTCKNHRSMQEDGFRCVLNGETRLGVLRVAGKF